MMPLTARPARETGWYGLGYCLGMSALFAAEVVLEGGAAKFGGRFGTITLALGLFLLPAMMSAAGFLVVRILGAAWRRRGGRGVVVAPAQGVPEAPGTAGAPPTVNPTR